MKLNIRLFATLKERTGASMVALEITEPGTVADLLAEFFRLYPNLQPFRKNIIVSINQEFAGPKKQILPGDEIALFPPVSGG